MNKIQFPSPSSNSVESIRRAFQQMAESVERHVAGVVSPRRAPGAQAGPGLSSATPQSSPGKIGPQGIQGPAGRDGSIADIVVARGLSTEVMTDRNFDIMSDSRGMAITGRTLESFPMTDRAGDYVMGG